MARRNLKLTLTFTVDEDLVRNHTDHHPFTPDGDNPYRDALNELRTIVHHTTAILLADYDPQLDNPQVEYNGIDYNTTTA